MSKSISLVGLFFILFFFNSCKDERDPKLNTSFMKQFDCKKYVLYYEDTKDPETKLTTVFDLNENIYAKFNLKNNNVIGPVEYYFKNEKLSMYEYYDVNSALRFRIELDSFLNVINIEGKSLYIVVDKKNRFAKVRDTIIYYPELAIPPGLSCEFTLYIDKTFQTDTLKRQYDSKSLPPLITYIFEDSSEVTFTFINELQDPEGIVIISDTINITCSPVNPNL